jgi:hypothetical protein
LSDNTRLLHEVLGYLSESLEACEIPPEPLDAAGKALYERLQIADLAGQLSMRVLDLKKNMDGASDELAFLRMMTANVAETQRTNLTAKLESNTRKLMLMHSTHEKSSSTLEIIQYIMAAMLAWGLLDRLTGPGWQVLDQEALKDFARPMIQNTPMVWFLMNIAFWGISAYVVQRVLNQMQFTAMGKLTVAVQIMQKVDMQRFNAYLATKLTALEARDFLERNSMVQVAWSEADREAWGGYAPYIQLEYDAETSFLHHITIHYNRRDAVKSMALTPPELRNKLCDEMLDAQIFQDPAFTFREELPEDDEEYGELVLDMGNA